MALHESAEMYLETIYSLSLQKPAVRSIDVAESMGYSKPSVSRAVSLLKQGGYLTTDTDGALLLTDSGREVAERITERHHVLTQLLLALGVEKSVAAEDACKIEHVISQETFEAIKHSHEKYIHKD